MRATESPTSAGKIDGMPHTLQLDLAAIRQIADRVTGIASLVAGLGLRLRLPTSAPATDSATLLFIRRSNASARQLGYTCEEASDELVRVIEALLGYANNAAILARRTELAIMGLDIEEFLPYFEVAGTRTNRRGPAVPGPADVPMNTDHRVLSEALLLSSGVPPAPFDLGVNVAQVRAAAGSLRACARALRAAMVSGERPAGMLDQYAFWLDNDLAGAIGVFLADLQSWISAYAAAQEQLLEPGRVYQRWLSGGRDDPARLADAAVQARTALRAYARTPLADARCTAPPRLADVDHTPE